MLLSVTAVTHGGITQCLVLSVPSPVIASQIVRSVSGRQLAASPIDETAF